MSKKDLEKQIISNLSAISHEIQTPVNLISATAKISGDKIENNSVKLSDLKNYMDNIISNCYKITMLISNITDLNATAVSRKEYVNTKEFLETFCKTPSTNIMEDREEFVEGSGGRCSLWKYGR